VLCQKLSCQTTDKIEQEMASYKEAQPASFSFVVVIVLIDKAERKTQSASVSL